VLATIVLVVSAVVLFLLVEVYRRRRANSGKAS
jgi:hypothetical protein